MTVVQVALYARVSSEQQAEAKTIESQLAEVRARIAADSFDLNTVVEFVDEAPVARRRFDLHWSVYAISQQREGGIASTCIVPIASLATTPIKSCCWMN